MARERLDALLRTGWAAGTLSVDRTEEPPQNHRPDEVPSGRRPISWRLDPGRRGAAAVLVAAVLAASLVGWRVLADRPRQQAVPVNAQLAVSPGSATTSASRPATSSVRVVIDVVGKVRRPGLVRLPSGSRVDDAVRAAGGALAGTDLSSVNLARVLVDGEQIAVGVPAANVGGGPAGTSGPSGTTSSVVNLNTATVARLDELPGVGPVLAQHIVDWRTAHGRFDSVDQLDQVTGIGDAKFADLKPLVTV